MQRRPQRPGPAKNTTRSTLAEPADGKREPVPIRLGDWRPESRPETQVGRAAVCEIRCVPSGLPRWDGAIWRGRCATPTAMCGAGYLQVPSAQGHNRGGHGRKVRDVQGRGEQPNYDRTSSTTWRVIVGAGSETLVGPDWPRRCASTSPRLSVHTPCTFSTFPALARTALLISFLVRWTAKRKSTRERDVVPASKQSTPT